MPDHPAPVPLGYFAAPEIELLPDVIAVDGFSLLPAGGSGRAWEFHPKALAGAAWDSNPLQAAGGSPSDAQLRLGAGFEARAEGAAGWDARLAGMLLAQRYPDTAGRSYTGGDAEARWRRRWTDASVSLDAAFDRASDPLAEIPEEVRRDRMHAGAGMGEEGRSERWTLGLAWDSLDYREDTPLFGRDDRDYRRLSATASWLALGGADSLAGVEGEVADLRRHAGSPANPYRSTTWQGRWCHAIGGRSLLDLRLGATLREASDDTEGDPANDDRRILAPAASAQLDWGWETHSLFRLRASTGLGEGVGADANASRRQALEGSFRLRLRDRLDLVGLGWATWRRDSAATSGRGVAGARDQYLRGGLDYRLREGLGVRLWSAWEHHDFTGGDYVRALVGLELVAAL